MQQRIDVAPLVATAENVQAKVAQFLRYELADCNACRSPFWRRQSSKQIMDDIENMFSQLSTEDRKSILDLFQPWIERRKDWYYKFCGVFSFLAVAGSSVGFGLSLAYSDNKAFQGAMGTGMSLLLLQQYDKWSYDFKFDALYNRLYQKDQDIVNTNTNTKN